MMHLIGFVVFGFIVGLIARAVMPGRDRMGLLITSVLGIIGAVLAGWLGRALGWYGPDEAAGFLMSIVGAIVVLGVGNVLVRKRVIPASASDREFPRRVA
jgi:uncharacterized membrane protein YeaQ/YmgE (transglycosylase-associated protein family)